MLATWIVKLDTDTNENPEYRVIIFNTTKGKRTNWEGSRLSYEVVNFKLTLYESLLLNTKTFIGIHIKMENILVAVWLQLYNISFTSNVLHMCCVPLKSRSHSFNKCDSCREQQQLFLYKVAEIIEFLHLGLLCKLITWRLSLKCCRQFSASISAEFTQVSGRVSKLHFPR